MPNTAREQLLSDLSLETCAAMLRVEDAARDVIDGKPAGFYCIDCNEVLPFPSSDMAAVNAHLAADLADPTR